MLTAMTTLSSKIVNVHKRKMAEIAVQAVVSVADMANRWVPPAAAATTVVAMSTHGLSQLLAT